MEESVSQTSPPPTSAESPAERPAASSTPGDWKQAMSGFWRTAGEVVFSPQIFFEKMSQTGGLKDPLIFLTACAGVNALLTGLFKLDLATVFNTLGSSLMGVLMCAAIATGIFKAMGGKGSFEATFRVLAYSEVTLLVGWLPAIQILGTFYCWILSYIGWRVVHQRSELKTAIVVFLSGAIASLVMLLNLCGWLVRSNLHF